MITIFSNGALNMVSNARNFDLDDDLKLWLKTKISHFYRHDPYLKFVDTHIALGTLVDALARSNNTIELDQHLDSTDSNNNYKISRKNDGKSYFDYPSLSFQINSLLHLWPKICDLYIKGKYLETRRRFGQKPNLDADFRNMHSPVIGFKDVSIFSNIKASYKDEYSEFRKNSVSAASKIIDNSSLPKSVLLVQTDIKKYFHSLKLDQVQNLIDENFKSISSETNVFFGRLKSEYGYESLPIGWMLSGIYSDLIAIIFHKLFDRKFQKILNRKKIKETEDSRYKKFVPHFDIEQGAFQKAIELLQISELEFKYSLSYVDDFIFIFEYRTSQQYADQDIQGLFEKIASHLIVEIAENLVNTPFSEKILRLYHPNENKCKSFSFDKSNLETMKSNFFSFNGNVDRYSEDNIWAQLEEFLLPTDNELTLNDKSQFYVNLSNLRQKTLEGESLKISQAEEILKKTLVKIKGEEAKYIFSIVLWLETLAITDYEKFGNFVSDSLFKIFAELQRCNKALDIWLKFFSAYFKIFRALSFRTEVKFFDDFDKFSEFWRGTVLEKSDDLSLLRSVKDSYTLKYLVLKNSRKPDWIKISESKTVKIKNDGLFSANFEPFEVSENFEKVVLNISFHNEIYSAISIFLFAVASRPISIEDYLKTAVSISKNLSESAANTFIRNTSYQILSRWNLCQIQSFLNELGDQEFFTIKEEIGNLIDHATKLEIDIGYNYERRIDFYKKVIFNKKIKFFPFMPPEIGQGNFDDPRSSIFFLTILNFNCKSDLIRKFLSTIIPIEKSRYFSSSSLPTTFTSTGLIFYNMIKKVLQDSKNSYNRNKLKKIFKDSLLLEKVEDGSTPLEKFKRENVCYVDVGQLDQKFQQESEAGSLLTLCPLGFSDEIFDDHFGYVFKNGEHEKLDLKIESAILEAKKRGSEIIVFPELTLPRKYLRRYLRMCSSYQIILVAGLEYTSDDGEYFRNSTVISFPIDPDEDPSGRSFIAFEQNKHFPAAYEKDGLEKDGVKKYFAGKNLFIFSSKKFCNFAILTCSDFLSLHLRYKLQEKVQTIFVPAQNVDMTTYTHIAESCIRDLHCFAAICNSQNHGGSFVYAPYRDQNKRTIFRKDGAASPEVLTINWEPWKVLETQKADSQKSFKLFPSLIHMKQTPPDWGYK